MKLKNIISATLFTIGFGITPYVHAHYAVETVENNGAGVLSTHDQKNSNLEIGSYDFVQMHTKTGKTFTDLWGFSLASDETASISIFDLELSSDNSSPTLQEFGKKYGATSTSSKLLDNKFLSFNLFDADGNLVGSAGENGTLSNLALHGGEWYTLSVSAQIKGIFGSAYHGVLDVAPSAVPLGDSLPFFASALGVLGLRYRKRLQLNR